MKLSRKCIRSFDVLNDVQLKGRRRKIEAIDELGFALLLQFAQLEAALKILRYWDKPENGWPDALNFIHANWRPLRDLKSEDERRYDLVIGSGGNSIRETRNLIAHEGRSVEAAKYKIHLDAVKWATAMLRCRVPQKYDLQKKVAALHHVNARKKPLKCDEPE